MYKTGVVFGKNLKRLRENAGITQSELAEVLGVSLRAEQRYESNEGRLPNTDIIDKIVEYFSISPSSLFVDIEDISNVNDKNNLENTSTTKGKIIAFLKKFREDNNLTIKEFSKYLDIPFNTYKAYEYGQNAIKPDVMDYIADKLDIEVYEMLQTFSDLNNPLLSSAAEIADNELQHSNGPRLEAFTLLADDFGLEIDRTQYKDLTREEIETIKALDNQLMMVMTWTEARETVLKNSSLRKLWLSSWSKITHSRWALNRVMLFMHKWNRNYSIYGKDSPFTELPHWVIKTYPSLTDWHLKLKACHSQLTDSTPDQKQA